jgi:neutral ceramidase
MKKIIAVLLLLTGTHYGADFRAGTARAVITPETPLWLSGYASRTNPATGMVHDLWAKALALEDTRGNRLVLVTTDLIGLPHEVSDEVARQLKKQYGLPRAQLVLNSSHTHSGPAVYPNLNVMFDLNPEDTQRSLEYRQRLINHLVSTAGAALSQLEPARMGVGHGTVGFAINRREPTAKGMRLGVNAIGPVDHDVPVITITTMEGNLRAVLFGYACHNTTLGGDFYSLNGDYAGFAQLELEKAHPGATAMFIMLCGADQNPHPRGKLELARQHGKSLADAVEQVLAGPLQPVAGSLRSAYLEVDLDFASHDRNQFDAEARAGDRFKQRRAKLMLRAYDLGQPIRRIAYPVQAVHFGKNLALVALGGEVVVDYALRVKRAYSGQNLIVAGYCSEVMAYIPSQRILREGGYEPVDSMIYYGQPGPFQDDVEAKVIRAIQKVLKKTGVSLSLTHTHSN